MNDADKARIEAEVEAILLELYESVSRGEVAMWMSTLHDQAGLWVIGLEVDDFRKTGEGFEAFWTSDDPARTVRQEIDDLKVRVVAVSPTVAHAVVTSPNRRWYLANGGVDRNATAETWVFVLAEEGWKLHSGQSAMFPLEDE